MSEFGILWEYTIVCGGKTMSYTRTIKFSYYTVCMMKDEQDNNPKRFDFESWISKAISDKIEKKEIEFNNVIARLEEMEGDEQNEIWKMKILKLRDTNIPSIVKKSEEAKPIELEDDEYIGEDLLIIYDSKKQVMMIQCNRFAMSKGKLEAYFNKIWGNQKEKIVLIRIFYCMNIRKPYYKMTKVFLFNYRSIYLLADMY